MRCTVSQMLAVILVHAISCWHAQGQERSDLQTRADRLFISARDNAEEVPLAVAYLHAAIRQHAENRVILDTRDPAAARVTTLVLGLAHLGREADDALWDLTQHRVPAVRSLALMHILSSEESRNRLSPRRLPALSNLIHCDASVGLALVAMERIGEPAVVWLEAAALSLSDDSESHVIRRRVDLSLSRIRNARSEPGTADTVSP